MHLHGELGAGIDDDALDLEIGAFFQNPVDSPWTMHRQMRFSQVRMVFCT